MFWFRKHETTVYLDDDTEEAFMARNAQVVSAWEQLRSWFLEQGYTLYEMDTFGFCRPSISTNDKALRWSGQSELKAEDEPPEWPYAYYGGDSSDSPYPLEANLTTKVCFAQDRQGRHVVIKRLGVLNDTEEERINRWIYENREEADKNCIIPTLDILEYENSSFAVMPRWGEKSCDFCTVGETVIFIHCLLKAINFLHSHSIIHRDVSENNILVNHFGSVVCSENNWLRPRLQSAGKLTYKLFDFDLSMMIPPEKRRLPSFRSFEILNIKCPNDTRQGELDYDPFIFEMGCIGIVLCRYFQRCVPIIPMLAPFLDRLVTDNLEERFTSSQALAFFEQMCAELTQGQLAARIPTYTHTWEIKGYNRWDGLPNDFLKKWDSFRALTPTLYTRGLRRLCTTYWGLRFVRFSRRFIRALKFLSWKSTNPW